MNKIYRVIFNHATQTWTAVSELAKGRTKTKSEKVATLAVAVSLALGTTGAYAATQILDGRLTRPSTEGGSVIIAETLSGDQNVIIGSRIVGNVTDSIQSVVIGNDILMQNGRGSIAIGGDDAFSARGLGTVAGQNFAAVAREAGGFDNAGYRKLKVTEAGAIGIGTFAVATGKGATAVGLGSTANVEGATSYGTLAFSTGTGSSAFGLASRAEGSNTLALGAGARATQAGSIAIGAGSVTTEGVAVTSAGQKYDIGGTTYDPLTNTDYDVNNVVSVGNATVKRQIQNVAPGQITETSTDAINGSQLYAITKGVQQIINNNYQTIQNNINNSGFHLKNNAGATVADVNKDDSLTFKNGTFTTATVNANREVAYNVVTQNINVANGVPTETGTAGLATAQTVATAIKNSGFNLQANGQNGSLIKAGDTVSINKGDNTDVVKTGNAITVHANKTEVTATASDIKLDTKVTGRTTAYNISLSDTVKEDIAKGVQALAAVEGRVFSFDGDNSTTTGEVSEGNITFAGSENIITTAKPANDSGYPEIEIALAPDITVDNVTVGSVKISKDEGINAGDKTITGVASGGDTGTNAANIDDVKRLAAAADTTASTSGTNGIEVVKTTVNGKTTDYQVGLTKATQDEIAKGQQALQAIAEGIYSFDGDNGSTTGNAPAGNISFAGSENIITTAKPANDSGYPEIEIALAPDITVDNVTVGTVKISKDGGINAGDKTITGVANAVNATDAVNLSQLNATKVSVVGGANITSVDSKVTDNGTTYTINAKDTSASVSNATGSPVSVTKGTEKDGVTDYVVDLTTKAKASLEKANTAVQSVTGKDGIVATTENNAVTVGLTPESKASLQKADSAIQEIKTTVNGQAVKTLNQADNTQDFKNGKNIDITTEDGKIIVATKPNVEFTSVSTNTLDAKIGTITDLTSVKMTTGSITATTASVDNLVADNANVGILLTRDSATIGGLLTANGGLAVASNQRIDMGDNQVHNVKAGTADTDAVNVSQLKANTTTVAAGKNITSVNEVRDANGIRYTIDGKDTTVSNAQGSPVSVTKGTEQDGVTDYVVDLTAEAKTSLEKANTAVQNVTGKDGITAEKQGDTVTVGLTPESQASLKLADSSVQSIVNKVNGQAVNTLTKNANEQDFVNGDNIIISDDNGAIKVATAKTVAFDKVTVGTASIDKDAGINAGNKTIKGVANATKDDEAVNLAQLKAQSVTVKAGQNVNSVNEVKTDDGITYTIDAKDTTVSKGSDAVTVEKGAETNGVTDYKVDLSADTKASLAKADSAVQEIETQIDGKTVKTVKKDDNTANFITGDNIELTDENGAIKVATKKDVTFTNVNTDTLTATTGTIGTLTSTTINNAGAINTQTLATTGTATIGGMLNANGGLTVANGQTVQMGNNRVQGVANAVESTDAVNLSQLNATKVSVVGGANITSVDSKVTADGTTYTINAKDTSATVSSANEKALKVTQGTPNNGITDFALDLGDDTKASLAKADTAVQNVTGKDGITAEKQGDTVTVGLTLESQASLKLADSSVQSIVNKVNGQVVNTLTKNANEQDFVNGDNIEISNDNGAIKVSTAKTVNFDKVTVGTASIDKDAGINAGNKTIQGVANGQNENDAVNVSQLNEVKNALQSSSQNYFHTNTGNNIGGDSETNYGAVGQSAGATALNSLAAGINAKATAQGASAVGHGAVASGQAASAIGQDSKAEGVNSVAIGIRSEALGLGSLALGETSKAHGEKALAWGGEAQAMERMTVAIGDRAIADKQYAFAMGAQSHANAEYSVAVGTNAETKSTALFGTAIGKTAIATGSHSTAIGVDSQSVGGSSVALGRQANSTGVSAIALGHEATTTQNHAVAVGSNSAANGANSIAVGRNASTQQDNSIALGTNAKSQAVSAVAIGNAANVTGINAAAIGYNSTVKNLSGSAFGRDASVSSDLGTALGAYAVIGENLPSSVALGANSEVRAGTPTTKAEVNGYTYTGFAGTNIAHNSGANSKVVSVGSVGAERQIQNVAAGQINATSTDAINGSQLFRVIERVELGKNFTGNAGDTTNLRFGETLNIAGDATTQGTYSSANIKTVMTDNNTGGALKIQIADNPEFKDITATSIKTGDNVLNGTGLTIGTASITNADGINAGNKTIKGVANATKDDEAVNLAQLKAQSVTVKAGQNVNSVNEVKTDDGITYTIDAKDTTVSKGSDAVTVEKGAETNGVTDYKVDLSADTKASLAKADSAVQEIETQIDGKTVKTVKKDDNTANFITGDNIELTDENGAIKVATKKDVTFTNVNTDTLTATTGTIGTLTSTTINNAGAINTQTLATTGTATIGGMLNANGGLTVANGQTVQMGNNRVQGVANAVESTDAVNLSQLNATKVSVVGGANITSVDSKVTADGTTYTINAKDTSATVSSANEKALKVTQGTPNNGITDFALDLGDDTKASLQKADSAVQTIVNQVNGQAVKTLTKDANTQNFVNGDNIVISDDNGAIRVSTAKEVTFDKVTVGTASIDKDAGINAGNKTVQGVADATKDDEAVNLSQLNATKDAINTEINKGLNFSADSGDTVNRKLGQTLSITGGNGQGDYSTTNVRTVTTADGVRIELADNPTFKNVKATDVSTATLSTTGDASIGGNANIAGNLATTGTATFGSKVTANGGMDLANNQINNVADGTADKDAVNVSQLRNNVTTLNNNIDAAKTELTAKGLDFSGNTGETHRDLGTKLAITGEATTQGNYSGANLKTVVTATGVALQFAENPEFKDIKADSIKTGDNVLNGIGLTIGTASITNADGINAGNKTIKGVANATANDEAVNLAQLKAQSVTVKAGQNVNSVNEVKTDDGITYTIDAKDTTVSKGSDAVTVEKGTETNGVTDYKVDLSADTKASLARADTAVQEIETQIDGKTVKTVKKDDNTANFITGDNIELTDENGAIKVATKKDVTFDKVNSTVIEAVDARINNVQADDIVTLDLTSTHANINTLESHQIRAGDIKASTGTITDLTSNHITANSIDARSVDVISLTAKDTKTDTLATTGNAQIGGKLTVQNGIDATNNRIENVANATRNSDAVNLAQLKANTTTVVAGANITSVDKVADENGVTYTINAKDTSATVSSANDKALKVTQGTPNNGITDFALELGDDTKASLAKADSSVQSIVNKVNGQAVNTLTKNANEQDFVNGDNIEITNDNGAIKVATKQNVSFTDVKTDTLTTTGTATIGGMLNANGGLTVANGQTVQMGNNRVQGVADGTADTDAVNVSQLRNNVTTLNNNIDAAKTELTAKGLDFSGNTGETHRDLGTKLAITGDATIQGNYSGANLKTVVTATGVALQFADNPEFKDIKADSIKTGDNVLNGTGLTIGTASITNADGINAGNKTIKGVANATKDDEAVNLAQLKAQSVTVKAGQNVNSVNEVKTADGITYTIDAKDTTVSKGSDAVTVEKGTETNGVTDYKVDLSNDTKASLAKADTAVQNVQGQGGITATKGADNVVTVDLDEATKANLTKADTAVQEIKTTVNGQAVKTLTKDNNTQDFVNGDNIEISNDSGSIKVSTAKTVNFDKVTVGTASIDKDAGINAGNKTIQGVANATKDDEAVNLSQLNATKNTINTEIAKGLNFSADSGNVVNRQLGDTFAIVGGNGQGDYSTANVRTVTTADGVRIELADNPTFNNVKASDVQTATLITTGDATIGGNMATTGTATIGGMLNANGGLTVANGQTVNMGNNRVQGVANAVESTDAVNLSQLNATKVSVVGGANITSVDSKVTADGTTYTINAKDTSATVSSANEKALKVTQGTPNNGITDFALDLGDDTKASLAKADTAVQNVQGQGGITATKGADNVVSVDLDEATKANLTKADSAVQEIKTTVNGQAVKTLTKDNNTQDFVNGDNIEISNDNGAIKVATKKDVTFTNVNTDTLTATTGTIGTLTSTTINNAGAINTATLATTGTATIGGMLNANGGLTVANGQTVNMGNNTISNVASGGDVGTNAANIDDVKRLAKSADTTASTSGTNGIEVLKVEQNGQVTDYQVGLTQATRDDIAKGVQASDDVANKGLTFTGDTGTTTAKKLGDSLAITGDDNISTTATANGVAISLNRNLTADSLSIGNVVINNAGINAGNQVISNVANGVADTDAVNVAQLKANSVKVVAGANITSVESQVTPNGTTYTINAKDTSASVSAASNALTVKAGEQNNGVIDYAIDLSDDIKASLNKANTGVQTVNGKDGITAEKQGDTVTVGLDDATKASLAKADTAVQVVNGKNGITATKTDNGYDVELDENTKASLAKADTAVQNITTKVNGKEVKTLNQADNSQDFVDGDNITITNDNGAIKVATKQNVSFTDVKTGTLTTTGDTTVGGTLTANGGLTVANGQTVNMGNNRIQGVANGVADTDAVNVAQLNNATKALNDNINTAVNNTGWTVKANGDNGQKVANNGEVNFVQGDNIIIERSGTDITVKTTDNPNFKQVTAQSVQATTVNATTVNTDAVNAKSVQADTVKTTGDVTVGGTLTANGGLTVVAGQPINMGGNVVNGVAPAEISPSSTQAVNGAQIYELQQGINRANAQLNDRITGVEESAYGGTASAIATGLLPQAFNPGESLGGVAVGTYKGASAVAVGFSSISDNGKYIFKLAGGATNTGDYSGGAAFGIKFR